MDSDGDDDRGWSSFSKKPQRKKHMKTPAQRMMLEMAYEAEKYPSEAVKADLALKLGITEKQLNMWFNHRRRKDRLEAMELALERKVSDSHDQYRDHKDHERDEREIDFFSSRKVEPMVSRGHHNREFMEDEEADEPKDVLMYRTKGRMQSIATGHGDDVKRPRKGVDVVEYQDRSASNAKAAARANAINEVKENFAEFREDGPPLVIDFDPLPPNAFGQVPGPESRKRRADSVSEGPWRGSSQERKVAKASHMPSGRAGGHPGTSLGLAAGVGRDELGNDHGRSNFRSMASGTAHRHGDGPGSSSFDVVRGSRGSYGGGARHGGGDLGHSRAEGSGRGGYGGGGRGGGEGKGRGRGRGGGARDDLELEETRHLEFLARARAEGDQEEIATQMEALDEIQARRRALAEEKLRQLEELERAKLDKKRKIEEMRIAKEMLLHEKRMQKELDRAEMARRKMEEQARKDLDRQERDKKREEERLLRERLKEEERSIRERRKEIERYEREKVREAVRVEKEKKREEIRLEREAAREKLAKEKALLKKLAKEAQELMDDEELELMEANRVLSGGCLLPEGAEGEPRLEGAEDLEGAVVPLTLSVVRRPFPPAEVTSLMKAPFDVAPWKENKEAVGDLLMVWSFAASFGAMLEISSFSLQELAQALHDPEARLLDELHVALLRMVLRDVADPHQQMQQAGIDGTGVDIMNNSPEARISLEAMAWGFDASQWPRQLSALTWPEILRRFALAAGIGPRRKGGLNGEYDRDEGLSSRMDTVTQLRSGAAVQAAVRMALGRRQKLAKYQVGCRRYPTKLTPGTIKYAAFKVLCVAGPEGLSVSEIVERVQSAGLRDFTRSRSPEATVVGVLSRDGLFLKLGVSRYCVKPQYRKDPADAESILAAAREAVAGVVPKDDAEEEKMDGEAKDDEEEEEGEDLEEVGVDAEVLPMEVTGADVCEEMVGDVEKGEKLMGMGEEGADVEKSLKGENGSPLGEGEKGQGKSLEVARTVEEVEDEEPVGGAAWVWGLTEGEYADLPVEQRLAALVDLTQAANDSRPVRAELERRQEAASAMRRQMWVEAQVGRKRNREEALKAPAAAAALARLPGHPLSAPVTPAVGLLVAPASAPDSAPGGSIISPAIGTPGPATGSPATGQAGPGETPAATDPAEAPGSGDRGTGGAIGEGMELSPATAGVPIPAIAIDPLAAAEAAAAKLRAKPSEIGILADEMYRIRVACLGRDRRYNRYWRYVTADAHDRGGVCAQLFFESAEDGHWEVIDTEECFDLLLGALDIRGVREAALRTSIARHECALRKSMRSAAGRELAGALTWTSPVGPGTPVAPQAAIQLKTQSVADAPELSVRERAQVTDKLREFKAYICEGLETKAGSMLRRRAAGDDRLRDRERCEECQEVVLGVDRGEVHCPYCHETVHRAKFESEAHFKSYVQECRQEATRKENQGPPCIVPPRLQKLKAELMDIEEALPADAFVSHWKDSSRSVWFQNLKRAHTPKQLLEAISALECAVARDWISPFYETTREILERRFGSGSGALAGPLSLPWVPHTSAAVAVHLAALSNALAFSEEEKSKVRVVVVQRREGEAQEGARGLRSLDDGHREGRIFGLEEFEGDMEEGRGGVRKRMGRLASYGSGVRTLGGGRGSRGGKVGGGSRGKQPTDHSLRKVPWPLLASEEFELPQQDFAPLYMGRKAPSGRGRGGRGSRGGAVGGSRRKALKAGRGMESRREELVYGGPKGKSGGRKRVEGGEREGRRAAGRGGAAAKYKAPRRSVKAREPVVSEEEEEEEEAVEEVEEEEEEEVEEEEVEEEEDEDEDEEDEDEEEEDEGGHSDASRRYENDGSDENENFGQHGTSSNDEKDDEERGAGSSGSSGSEDYYDELSPSRKAVEDSEEEDGGDVPSKSYGQLGPRFRRRQVQHSSDDSSDRDGRSRESD